VSSMSAACLSRTPGDAEMIVEGFSKAALTSLPLRSLLSIT
jgi:hypothetical protein